MDCRATTPIASMNVRRCALGLPKNFTWQGLLGSTAESGLRAAYGAAAKSSNDATRLGLGRYLTATGPERDAMLAPLAQSAADASAAQSAGQRAGGLGGVFGGLLAEQGAQRRINGR
jgi:hypothetical protein